MKNNNSKKVLKVVGVLALVVVSVVAYMGLKFYELENGLHFMDSATCLFAAIAVYCSLAAMKKEKKASLEQVAENA